MNHIVALVMGVVLLAGSLWIRHGSARARFWVPKKRKDISRSGILIIDERWVLVFLPALGLFFLMIGAILPAYALGKPWSYLFVTLCLFGAIVGLIGMVWGLTNLYYPEGLRPAWLREYYRLLGYSPSLGLTLAPKCYREHLQDEHLENPRLRTAQGKAEPTIESAAKKHFKKENRSKRKPR